MGVQARLIAFRLPRGARRWASLRALPPPRRLLEAVDPLRVLLWGVDEVGHHVVPVHDLWMEAPGLALEGPGAEGHAAARGLEPEALDHGPLDREAELLPRAQLRDALALGRRPGAVEPLLEVLAPVLRDEEVLQLQRLLEGQVPHGVRRGRRGGRRLLRGRLLGGSRPLCRGSRGGLLVGDLGALCRGRGGGLLVGDLSTLCRGSGGGLLLSSRGSRWLVGGGLLGFGRRPL
mmetsp:Transcript_60424/g.176646  ORF Transcript_60424/g.176646 Transcript_60424/m.176646 type:complete len:233 (-) Transcript_60424:101-799(-)